MLRLQRLAAAREQLIENELARPGDLCDQAEKLIPLFFSGLGTHPVADAIEAGGEADVVDRLQQIVDRARIKGPNGVLIVRGDEHHERHTVLRKLREHVEARHAGHLDVEEHHIGPMRGDCGNGFAPIRALRGNLEVRRREQANLQTTTRERFVVDDDRSDALAAVHATRDPCWLSGRPSGRLVWRLASLGRRLCFLQR